jgi:hypothetical protein
VLEHFCSSPEAATRIVLDIGPTPILTFATEREVHIPLTNILQAVSLKGK